MDDLSQKIIDLLKTKKEDITINQIAKELNIERHTASHYLESLRGLGVCSYRTIGKSKIWKLTDSPLLTIVKENSPLSKELEMFMGLVDNTILVQNADYDIIWTNKRLSNKKCFELHGEKKKCVICPVDKTFSTGKAQKSKCKNANIVTKPIKNKDGKTVAVINVIK